MSKESIQIERAEELLLELSIFGVYHEELDVVLLLDALACAGLKLSKDNQGIAAAAFSSLCISAWEEVNGKMK